MDDTTVKEESFSTAMMQHGIDDNGIWRYRRYELTQELGELMSYIGFDHLGMVWPLDWELTWCEAFADKKLYKHYQSKYPQVCERIERLYRELGHWAQHTGKSIRLTWYVPWLPETRQHDDDESEG